MNLELFVTEDTSSFPGTNEHIEVNWDFVEHLQSTLGVAPCVFEAIDSSFEFGLLCSDVIEII